VLATRTSATDPARMHLRATMKGLSGERSSQERPARYESELGKRDPNGDYPSFARSGDRPTIALRGLESSRVRPDHVLCCIAPAMSERSASSPLTGRARKRAVVETIGVHLAPIPESSVTQRAKAPWAGVAPYRSRDAK
jgi:hypothetical protein